MSTAIFKDLPTTASIAYDSTTLSGYGITDAYSKSDLSVVVLSGIFEDETTFSYKMIVEK